MSQYWDICPNIGTRFPRSFGHVPHFCAFRHLSHRLPRHQLHLAQASAEIPAALPLAASLFPAQVGPGTCLLPLDSSSPEDAAEGETGQYLSPQALATLRSQGSSSPLKSRERAPLVRISDVTHVAVQWFTCKTKVLGDHLRRFCNFIHWEPTARPPQPHLRMNANLPTNLYILGN